jgi:hypothetical protein
MHTPTRSTLLVLALSAAFSGCTEYEVKARDEPSLPGDTAILEPDTPDIGVDPLDVDLGVVCGSDSTQVRISSLGTAPLTIFSISSGGAGWSIDSLPALPRELLPGETMGLEVSGGDGGGGLYIESDDPDTPLWEVPLSATLDEAPELVITTPTDGDILEPGASTDFTASVSDLGDAVEDMLVEWSSDVDGVLASSVPAADGSASFTWDSASHSSGDHVLMASVVDSCESEASDEVLICQNEGYTEENLALSTWNFEGSAQWDSGNSWVELTNTSTNQAGTAFQTSTTVDSDSIVIEFSFFVSGGSGADGISLTALDSTRMSGFVGSTGGGIGYAGLPGWSIEVDTWYNSENNDPTQGDHLSVHIDGNQTSYATWAELPEMEDGNWHDMAVTVSGSHMTVEVDGTTYIDTGIGGLSAFPAYVGFTGATGASTNYHLIDSLEVEAFVCED